MKDSTAKSNRKASTRKANANGSPNRENAHAESGASPPAIIRPFAPGYFGKDAAKRYEVTLLRRPGEYIVELVNQAGYLKFVIAKASGIEYADEFLGKYVPDLQAKEHIFFHLPSEPTEPGELADLVECPKVTHHIGRASLLYALSKEAARSG